MSWNMAGAVFSQGSTFLTNVILANLWGVRLFGEYAIVQSTIVTTIQVGQLAIGYTATRYVAEFRASDPARASRLLGLCELVAFAMAGAATLALLAAAKPLASRALGQDALWTVLFAGAFVVFPSIANGFMNGALAGLEAYPALGRVGIVSGIAYVLPCTLGGWLAGVHGAFIGAAASATLQALLLRRALLSEARRQNIEPRLEGARHELRTLLHFALPVTLNTATYLPSIWLTNALLVGIGGGFEQMALFAAANNFRIVVLFVPSIVTNVGMSLLNNQRGNQDERRFRLVFWTNLAVTGLIVAGGAALLAWLGPWLLPLFGPAFTSATPVLPWIVAAAVPETLALSLLHPIQNQNRAWLVFGTVIVPCCATLVLTAWQLIPETGAVGLARAYLAGWSLALVASVVLLLRFGVWGRPR